jgi:hypothetical protein
MLDGGHIVSSVNAETALRAWWRQVAATCSRSTTTSPEPNAPPDPPAIVTFASTATAVEVMSSHRSGDIVLTIGFEGGALSNVAISDLERAAHEPAWMPPSARAHGGR